MFNEITLIGNLGQDPEVRTFENGTKKAKTSIATNEVYKNAKGEKVKDITWHYLEFWGKLAELVEIYCKAGKQLFIKGVQKHETYEGKDGTKKKYSYVKVTSFKFLGNGASNESTRGNEAKNSTVTKAQTTDTGAVSSDDDLPF